MLHISSTAYDWSKFSKMADVVQAIAGVIAAIAAIYASHLARQAIETVKANARMDQDLSKQTLEQMRIEARHEQISAVISTQIELSSSHHEFFSWLKSSVFQSSSSTGMSVQTGKFVSDLMNVSSMFEILDFRFASETFKSLAGSIFEVSVVPDGHTFSWVLKQLDHWKHPAGDRGVWEMFFEYASLTNRDDAPRADMISGYLTALELQTLDSLSTFEACVFVMTHNVAARWIQQITLL